MNMAKFPLMSDAAKRKWQDPEYRRKQSEDRATRDYNYLHTSEVIIKGAKTRRGVPLSSSHKQSISKALEGVSAGSKNPMFGKPPTNKGKKKSYEWKLNVVEIAYGGFWYGAVRYYYVMTKKPRDPVSEQGRANMRASACMRNNDALRARMRAKRGSLNPRWKGGISTLNHSIRDCKKGLDWRQAVFERDDYTCQVTGQRGGRLHAHHIVQIKDLIEKFNIKTLEEAYACEAFWDVSNGVTMTETTHTEWHMENGK